MAPGWLLTVWHQLFATDPSLLQTLSWQLEAAEVAAPLQLFANSLSLHDGASISKELVQRSLRGQLFEVRKHEYVVSDWP
mmetsp:Transcript_26060/g.51020  ORF Transcript_26060/g.51020 Transcript_26060/m.51020 type:complete len:80 (+) Transcript_26060:309-548(+)